MSLHVPNGPTGSGPFSELFLEESIPGSPATTATASDACPGLWLCGDLLQGVFNGEGLRIDAGDPGVAAALQGRGCLPSTIPGTEKR